MLSKRKPNQDTESTLKSLHQGECFQWASSFQNQHLGHMGVFLRGSFSCTWQWTGSGTTVSSVQGSWRPCRARNYKKHQKKSSALFLNTWQDKVSVSLILPSVILPTQTILEMSPCWWTTCSFLGIRMCKYSQAYWMRAGQVSVQKRNWKKPIFHYCLRKLLHLWAGDRISEFYSVWS